MANKNFQNYAVAGNNVALTYDNVGDTVTIDVNVDKNDVGLGNVDNTSDINKPISTLVQNALNLKEGVITAGTTAQYYRGDKTFQTLDKTAVGLSNVDNTSDANKPISNATQTALNGKQPLATNLTSISALTFASTSFVKMTAAGTFALDTNTYLTAESDTLASVTGRGNVTTNAITVGGLTVATNLIYTDTVNGRVGIGTASPTHNLHVKQDQNGITQIRVDNATNDTNSRAAISVGSSGDAITIFRHLSNYTAVPSYANKGGIVTDSGLTGGFFFRTSAGAITFQPLGTDRVVFAANGNVLINTTTDSGFRLDVNGTARIQNQLTTTGSITAASAIARGVYMNQTLVAAANGDVLVGLDINPTFTNGAFTGVTNIPLRIAGNSAAAGILFVGQNWKIGSAGGNITYNGGNSFDIYSGISATPITFSTTSRIAQFHYTTGNLTLQNGGTFTDAGFRLDVNGTARVQNVLTLGNLATDPTGANGMIYYNTTSNVFRKYINGAWANL
jgi:hypothetical protein